MFTIDGMYNYWTKRKVFIRRKKKKKKVEKEDLKQSNFIFQNIKISNWICVTFNEMSNIKSYKFNYHDQKMWQALCDIQNHSTLLGLISSVYHYQTSDRRMQSWNYHRGTGPHFHRNYITVNSKISSKDIFSKEL